MGKTKVGFEKRRDARSAGQRTESHQAVDVSGGGSSAPLICARLPILQLQSVLPVQLLSCVVPERSSLASAKPSGPPPPPEDAEISYQSARE